jgi:hypothetical protein
MRSQAFLLIASRLVTAFSQAATTGRAVLVDLGTLLTLCLRSRAALAAENLFLRKQLALFEERKGQPHRATDAVRFVMSALGRLFDWRGALRVVQPDSFIRWHRKGFRLFWRWKSRPRGRPRLPCNLRELIRRMAAESTIWGEPESPTSFGSNLVAESLLVLSASTSAREAGRGALRIRSSVG